MYGCPPVHLISLTNVAKRRRWPGGNPNTACLGSRCSHLPVFLFSYRPIVVTREH